MQSQQTPINEILSKLKDQSGFKIRLIEQKDDKASLELQSGRKSYSVAFIYEPRAVFSDFAHQHKSLLMDGDHGSVFLHFFANKQKEWILRIDRWEDCIEVSLDKVSMLWKKLNNKFNCTCTLNEYIAALYSFVDHLPDHPLKQKGGIENSKNRNLQ